MLLLFCGPGPAPAFAWKLRGGFNVGANGITEEDDSDDFAAAPVTVNTGDACVGQCMYGATAALAISALPPEEEGSSCSCTLTEQEDCHCRAACGEEQQQRICTEILGPCMCFRSNQAVCECSGYCHSARHRRYACEDEPGGEWTGQWCEAEVGLLWS